MENIKIVLILIINILVALLVNFGVIFKLRAYIFGKKNNNITGDNMFVYETMPFMEKYHIRERLGRGERHRMPKAAVRYELKYWSIGLLFTLSYIIVSLYTGFGLENIGALLFAYAVCIITINKMGKKKQSVISIFFEFLLIIISFIPSFIEALHYKIKELADIAKLNFIGYGLDINNTAGKSIVKLLSVKWAVLLIIPVVTILGILLISLIKRRFTTVLIAILCCIYTSLIYLYIMDSNSFYIIHVTIVAYYYLTMLIFQTIYNKRALKKITVLVK